jgi:hypothetical protein
MVLRSVGILSAGKICGAMGVFIGLLIGGFMALLSLAGIAVQAQGNGPQVPAMFLGIGALIFVPLFYGFFAFITGLIYAAIYNFLAGIVGGLELDIVRVVDPTINS